MLNLRRVAMAFRLCILAVWSACLCGGSLTVAGAFEFYPGRFYWFTVPFIAASGLGVLGAVVGLCWRARRSMAFWVVGVCHAALPVPFLFAMVQWPGGDDGPGMAWLFFIGGGSVVAMVLGAMLMLHARWASSPDAQRR